MSQIIHRVQVALDCECGTTVEACADEELLDDLLEHIAAVYEVGARGEPASIIAQALGGMAGASAT